MESEGKNSQRALIDRLIKARLSRQAVKKGIPSHDRSQTTLLSYGQERLWFLEQFSPDSQAYNRPAHLRIKGPLDQQALEKTLEALTQRHESLRTRFITGDQGPEQNVQNQIALPLSSEDLQTLPEDVRETEAQRRVEEETMLPFDLSEGPLIRARLLKLAPNEHLLLLTFHHIVFDGWSQTILFKELSYWYAHFKSQGPPPGDLPTQYADFSMWQRKQFEDGKLNADLDYWKTQLANAPQALTLPTDHPRPNVQTYSGARYTLQIGSDLLNRVSTLAKQQDTTVFVVQLTAFFTLLHRYSHQTDITVGFPIAGRERSELEDLIGFFINTLVLRADLSGEPDFLSLLARIHEAAMSAYKHQALPFENLLQQLSVERDLSRSPLFQVFFQYRNYPNEPLQFEGLQVERYELDSTVEKFDLFIDTQQEDDGSLRCQFRYNTDLFEASTIERMAGHYQRILELAVAAPEVAVARWDLLQPTEKAFLLNDWNNNNQDLPSIPCIQKQFEAQVDRCPDTIALRFQDQELSYTQLDQRANCLANKLITDGIQKEALVAIHLAPGVEQIVCVLGTLKAGVAFVPVDVELPPSRLAILIQSADYVLTQDPQNLPLNHEECTVIEVSADLLEGQKDLRPEIKVDQHNLAYLIYTSGSTGRPKGVMIEHLAIANLLQSMTSEPGFAEGDSLLSITNLSFDIGVSEILLPLCTGGTLILASRETVKDPHLLKQIIHETQPSLMMGTPAVWKLLCDSDWEGSRNLSVITAGEALSPSLASSLLEKVDELWNFYGPTEATVYATGIKIEPGFNRITIGKPLENLQCYVLDSAMQLAPIGVPGELYLGGVGLARGYHNQEELTRESFVTHTLEDGIKRRLYKTGDLVRWLSDGTLVFLSRLDQQLKVRGFRIEPGEIEQVLSAHPDVNTCTVVGHGSSNEELELIAYVVPNSSETTENSTELNWQSWQHEQVAQWETIWDETFSAPPDAKDPTCNTAGVISSFTGEPVVADEARDWVEHAANRVLALRPTKVLDVGCGLGRTLFRVAPSCSRYWGLDFAKPALEYVEAHLNHLPPCDTDIRFFHAAANEVNKVPDASFDLVILNGVVQYFPSTQYLLDAIEQAMQRIPESGHIFIGDVRNLSLLQAFHLSVELFQANKNEAFSDVIERVDQKVRNEEELLVDPSFFRSLPESFSRITAVEIQLKRGWPHNELTRFRYDVTLKVSLPASENLPHLDLDWETDQVTPDRLSSILEDLSGQELHLAHVPNVRVHPEVALYQQIDSLPTESTVGSIDNRLESDRASAYQPELFWQLASDHQCDARIDWSKDPDTGCFDVRFRKMDDKPTSSEAMQETMEPSTPDLKTSQLSKLGNNPLLPKASSTLSNTLKKRAEERLPHYMVPSMFVVIEELPLTSNGKIDRKRLPVPQVTRAPESGQKATTPLQLLIAEAWSEILDIKNIKLDENFFELGGHSLSAARILNRLNRRLSKRVSLVALFNYPTIGGLAEYLESQGIELTES